MSLDRLGAKLTTTLAAPWTMPQTADRSSTADASSLRYRLLSNLSGSILEMPIGHFKDVIQCIDCAFGLSQFAHGASIIYVQVPMELFKVAAVKPVRAVDLGAHSFARMPCCLYLLSYVICWLCVLVQMYKCT